MPNLMNIEAVALAVGLSRPSIYRLIARGQFPPGTAYGRRVLWPADVIQAWLDNERRAGMSVPLGSERRDINRYPDRGENHETVSR